MIPIILGIRLLLQSAECFLVVRMKVLHHFLLDMRDVYIIVSSIDPCEGFSVADAGKFLSLAVWTEFSVYQELVQVSGSTSYAYCILFSSDSTGSCQSDICDVVLSFEVRIYPSPYLCYTHFLLFPLIACRVLTSDICEPHHLIINHGYDLLRYAGFYPFPQYDWNTRRN